MWSQFSCTTDDAARISRESDVALVCYRVGGLEEEAGKQVRRGVEVKRGEERLAGRREEKKGGERLAGSQENEDIKGNEVNTMQSKAREVRKFIIISIGFSISIAK